VYLWGFILTVLQMLALNTNQAEILLKVALNTINPNPNQSIVFIN
jgi:hypothetical protein